MRFAEVIDGRVRYVLPVDLAGSYAVLPPNAVEIALEAEVYEGDVFSEGVFRRPTTEEINAPVLAVFRAERDRLFSETQWVRERHADRLALGLDDTANWTEWLIYWQFLRDMPDGEGFDPAAPAWPVQPV